MNQKELIESEQLVEYVICSPLGTYPKQSISVGANGLFVQNDLVLLGYLSSQPWQKEKLLTALLTATNFKCGFLKLYFLPFTHSCTLSDEPAMGLQISQDIIAKKTNAHVSVGEIIPEFDQYQNAKGASLPMILGGVPYHQVAELMCADTFKQVLQLLDAVRYDGLYEIIELLQESSQLSCHLQFQVQANHYLLLALQQLNKADWSKEHPLLKEWLSKDFSAGSFALAKDINPIEYVKLFKAVVVTIKNSILI